jgi:cytidylate kinase
MTATARAPVIAVDGPSGTGKGTVCTHLAHWLGWHFLDSGTLYRLVAIQALRQGVGMDDEAGLAHIACQLEARFESEAAGELVKVWLGNEDASDAVRSEESSLAASRVAAWPAVRIALLEKQRAYRRPPGLVADGRDMGTVVFPDAELKIFLTASPEERARRRYKQLKQKGIDVNLAQLLADIAERDARDSQRTISPLKPAPDAVVIDTTGLEVAAVLSVIAARVVAVFPDVPVLPGAV